MVNIGFSDSVFSKTNTLLERYRVALLVAMALCLFSAVFIMPVIAEEHDHDGWTDWAYTNSLPNITGNYYLRDNVRLNSNQNINGNVKLCLNGYTIDLGGNNKVQIIINGGAHLELYDCSDVEHHYRVVDNLWVLDEDGDKVLTGGVITGGNSFVGPGDGQYQNGGAISIANNGKFTMYGGNIVGNKARAGGAVVVSNFGNFTMIGGNITGNKANTANGEWDKGTGGGIESSGILIINGGNVTDNYADDSGGGVCTWASNSGGSGYKQQFTMNGGRISNNVANTGRKYDYGGGGIYASERTNTEITGGEISGNHVYNWANGGGIHVHGSSNSLTISGVNVVDNEVHGTGNGGGVSIGSGVTTKISGNIIVSGNTKSGDNNNLYLPSGRTLTIDRSAGGLLAGSSIYVTAVGDIIATDAVSGEENYFHSDDTSITFECSGGIIKKYEAPAPTEEFPEIDHGSHHPEYPDAVWHEWNAEEAGTKTPSSSGYYVLTSDVQLNSKWTIASGADIHLCLNGSVLDLNNKNIEVKSGASLTICDCNDFATHNFNIDGSDYHWVLTSGEGERQVVGGVITNGESGSSGGGIYVSGGTLTLEKGNIVGNRALSASGGGVFVGTGKFVMNGGNVLGNVAKNGGGGVETDADFTMNGGNISENRVADGGGVTVWYQSAAAKFTMTGGNITQNTATNRGGGLFVSGNSGTNPVANITGGRISDNFDSGSNGGGGIFINVGQLSLSNCEISNNTAYKLGGGVYFGGGTLSISGNLKVYGNKLSAGTPDNIYLPSGKTITIADRLGIDSTIGFKTQTTSLGTVVAINAVSGEDRYFISDNTERMASFSSSDSKIVLAEAQKPDPEFPESTHTHDDGEYAGIKWYSWLSTINRGPNSPCYYVLEDNVELASDWTVPNGLTHLCLNGHVLNLNGHSIKLNSNRASLVICDCKDDRHNFGVSDSLWEWDSSEIESDYFVNGGVITGGTGHTESGTQKGGAFFVDGGSLVMQAGHLVGNTASSGGAVYVKSGSFSMSNGTLTGNTAIWGGGGLEIGTSGDGVFKMTGGRIANNTLTSTSSGNKIGGGVHAGKSSSVTIIDGEIVDNAAKHEGKGVGIYVGSESFTLGGKVNITGNKAGDESPNNVYLKVNKVANFSTVKPFDTTSIVGVSSEVKIYKGNNVSVTGSGGSSYDDCFIPDGSLQIGVDSNGAVYLYNTDKVPDIDVVTHSHDGDDEDVIWYGYDNTKDNGPTIPNHYVLTENVQLGTTHTWTVPIGTTYLCLNGNVLDLMTGHIVVPDGATLILCDCKFGDSEHVHYFKPKEIDHTDGHDHKTWVWANDATSGEHSLAGGVITGGYVVDNGGAIMVKDGGKLEMYGGNIVGNEAIKTTDPSHGAGGGVWSQGEFYLYNGNITGNFATSGGGGVQTTGRGANDRAGLFVMYGGNITHNNVREYGGGLTLWSSTARLYGGNIDSNEALIDGGGMFVEFSNCYVNNTNITNNLASYGGGVCVYKEGKAYLYGGNITGNSAHRMGGGITAASKEKEKLDDMGRIYIAGVDNPINISGNILAGTGGTIRDDYYLPSFKTMRISNGDNPDYIRLHPDTNIGYRIKDSRLESVQVSEKTIEDNAQYLHPNSFGDYFTEYHDDNQCLYYTYREEPDLRFALVNGHHLNHTREHEVGHVDTWLDWNESCNMLPGNATHYVMTTDIKLDDEMNGVDNVGHIPCWTLNPGTTYLCLNGHILDLNDHYIKIPENSRLVICDCQRSNVHYYFDEMSNGLWKLSADNGQTPTDHELYGGIITNSTQLEGDNVEGAAFRVEGGVIDIVDGNIVGNEATRGAGIWINKGMVRSSNGVIAGNVAYIGAAGVGIINEGRFEMSGGSIHHNTAANETGKGAGVALGTSRDDESSESMFLMSGGTIHSNKIDGGDTGSGVYVGEIARVGISGDAVIDKNNNFYLNTSANENPIRVWDDKYTGSVMNITGDENHIKVPYRVVAAHPGTTLVIEDVASQFALGEEWADRYVLAVKHTDWARELVVARKEAVSLITVRSNPTAYESLASIVPIGSFNVPKNSNDSSAWDGYPWTAKSYQITVKPIGSTTWNLKEDATTRIENRTTEYTYSFGGSVVSNDKDFLVTFPDHQIDEYHLTIEYDARGTDVPEGKTPLPGTTNVYVAEPMVDVNLTVTNDKQYISLNITVVDEASRTNVLETKFLNRSSIGNTETTIYNFTMPSYNVLVNTTFGLRGDADLDDNIDIIDAACVGINIIREDGTHDLLKQGTYEFLCADVDGNEVIDVVDLLAINRYLVGYTVYPTGPYYDPADAAAYV